jgi:hypothetical protein
MDSAWLRLKSRASSSDPFHGMLALQRATQRCWYKAVGFHKERKKERKKKKEGKRERKKERKKEGKKE